MPRLDSTATSLVVAAALAAAIGYGATEWVDYRKLEQLKAPAATTATVRQAQPAASLSNWVASAPGRVEPKSGILRLSPLASGKVVETLARAGDQVQAGDPLVRIDDEEARARLSAAQAEAEVRRRERDAETVAKPAQDRRAAEDAVAAAERALHAARTEFDRVYVLNRNGSGTAEDVAKARSAVSTARQKLEQERTNLTRVAATAGMPTPTRLEAALAAARSEVTLAELIIERSRLRAPIDGTILRVNVKTGEAVASSAETPAVAMGDLASLRVKGEVEERDIAKMRVGQRVTVRSSAFPGQDYTGKVGSIAQTLGVPRLGPGEGPRKPTDVDVLEVSIDLDGRPPLMPGMRVDVYFAPDATVQSTSPPPMR
jgi:HlyD family secretion protein